MAWGTPVPLSHFYAARPSLPAVSLQLGSSPVSLDTGRLSGLLFYGRPCDRISVGRTVLYRQALQSSCGAPEEGKISAEIS